VIDEITGDFLQWLRGFYFVAKKGSITEAAFMMRREQPTITHQIKCLEKEFGVILFDRSSGKMKLTPEGKVLIEKAISLFEIIKEIRNEMGKDQLEYQGEIIVATSHAIINFFLPRYIVEFRKTHPRVNFDIGGGGVDMILEKVESSEADFGIANVDSVPKTMIFYELFETGLKLIVPKNHKYFSSESPDLREIAQSPLILFPRTTSITTIIERKFAECHLKPNVIMIRNNFVSVKKFVALGLGASMLDSFVVTKEDEKTIDVLSLDQYFPKRKYGLLLRKRKYITPAAKAFIHIIKPDIQF
jgi:DNA-binding transcriptional LysR family regulator